MTLTPNTRASLIARLSDVDDVEAWQEFVEIYLPLLYRLARQKGLQHADAEELGQEVLIAVSRAIHRWEPDPARGRFRNWLFRVARNLILNFLTQPKRLRTSIGNSQVHLFFDKQAGVDEEASSLVEIEYRREVFSWAVEKVRPTVAESTWNAFWQSSVEAQPIAEVAKNMGISIGKVYIARSRVMTKLRKAASHFEGHHTRHCDTSQEYSQ
jgi:RNA polymerase sigma factor (sigma-70 family)